MSDFVLGSYVPSSKPKTKSDTWQYKVDTWQYMVNPWLSSVNLGHCRESRRNRESGARGRELDVYGARADLTGVARGNVPVRWTNVDVRHTGYTDPELRERKLQRDCKILESELAERPDDPFVLFNLGSIAVERQDWPTALGHLQRSLRVRQR